MKFTARISNAWAAFKSSMRFPSDYGYGGLGWLWEQFTSTRKTINYAAELGDLSKLRQSSLIMTAVTWVGLRFPEPMPAVFTIDSEGKAKEDVGHVVTKALRRPNQFYSGKTIAKAVALNWVLNGNVFWRVLSNSAGEPLEIWPIPFWMMEPRWNRNDSTEFIGWYEHIVDGRGYPVDIEEIIHFRDGIDPLNPRRGMSPLGGLLREVYTDNEVGNFAAALMTNAGVPEFMLIPKEGMTGLTHDERKFLKEEFEAMRTGANRGKAILATRGLEVQKLTFEPSKLDLSALRDIPESRLASVIGIPASALGLNIGIKNNTYSNAKELGEDATEGYLVPLWSYFAEELTAYFQARGVLKENQEIRYKLGDVRALQEDKNAQAERNATLFQANLIKRSEARSDQGLPSGPEDELYLHEIEAALQEEAAERASERQAELMRNQPDRFAGFGQDGPPNGKPKPNGEQAQEKRWKSITGGLPTRAELQQFRSSWMRYAPRIARGLYQNGKGANEA